MEKQFYVMLSQSDIVTLGSIFDIVFKTKGMEAANPIAPISLLLKKIQESMVEIPTHGEEKKEQN